MHLTEKIINNIKPLIARNSISNPNEALDHGNLEVIELLAQWFSNLGFQITIDPVNESKKKYNMIATIGNQDANNTLIFSGHTDTVAYNRSSWFTDPFQVIKKENKIFGLGTSDMKSFFAVLQQSINDQISEIKNNNQALTIVATADEETSMSGIRHIQKNKSVQGAWAIIGEPSNMKPIHMHKGILMMQYDLYGQSGHSSDPRNGQSALEGMHEFMSFLLDWRNEKQQQENDPRFSVPFPTLNLGQIIGGDSANRICAHCSLTIDCRILPGHKIDDIKQLFSNKISAIAQKHELNWETESLFSGVDALQTNRDDIAWIEKITGLKSSAVNYGTEGPFFQEMGIPCIILGPGSITEAHTANEFITIEQLQIGYETYSKILSAHRKL